MFLRLCKHRSVELSVRVMMLYPEPLGITSPCPPLSKIFCSSSQLQELAGAEGALVARGRESDLLFWVYQTGVLCRRSWKNMTRNIGVYWLRVVMYWTLTFCIGTIYFRLGTDYASINARAAHPRVHYRLLRLHVHRGLPGLHRRHQGARALPNRGRCDSK